jgi:hypothetical protein
MLDEMPQTAAARQRLAGGEVRRLGPHATAVRVRCSGIWSTPYPCVALAKDGQRRGMARSGGDGVGGGAVRVAGDGSHRSPVLSLWSRRVLRVRKRLKLGPSPP